MADAAAVTDPAPNGGMRYLGWRAERRPRAGFAHVLGAVAGAFVVIATVAFVSAIDNDDPQAPGIVLSLVLLALALAIGWFGTGPLRSAATTMAVGAVPLLWTFAIYGDGGSHGRGDVRALLLLSIASYVALYLLAWTRGRAVLLAIALVLIVVWVAFEVAGSGSSLFGATTSVPSFGATTTNASDTSDATRAVVMALGLVYLLAGGLLDARRLAGIATSFLVVGTVSATVGGVSLGAQDSTLVAGIVAALIGGSAGVIGAAAGRRGTTWLGVVILFGGAVAIFSDLAPDGAGGVGALALAFAAVIGGAAWLLARVLGEPDDGDDGAAVPTAPVGGPSAESA